MPRAFTANQFNDQARAIRKRSYAENRALDLLAFLDYVYQLVDADKAKSASVAIMDYIDHLHNTGRFSDCDRLLRLVDQGRLPSSLRRAFLMITFPAKEHLSHRPSFFQESLRLLSRERDPETAKKMLKSIT